MLCTMGASLVAASLRSVEASAKILPSPASLSAARGLSMTTLRFRSKASQSAGQFCCEGGGSLFHLSNGKHVDSRSTTSVTFWKGPPLQSTSADASSTLGHPVLLWLPTRAFFSTSTVEDSGAAASASSPGGDASVEPGSPESPAFGEPDADDDPQPTSAVQPATSQTSNRFMGKARVRLALLGHATIWSRGSDPVMLVGASRLSTQHLDDFPRVFSVFPADGVLDGSHTEFVFCQIPGVGIEQERNGVPRPSEDSVHQDNAVGRPRPRSFDQLLDGRGDALTCRAGARAISTVVVVRVVGVEVPPDRDGKLGRRGRSEER